MERTDVIVIGAGQAGLAASACLSARGLEHVVLERGAVGERWRNERWASLRLLTPNWMSHLPGLPYEGDDPHGFMHKDEVTGLLTRYARRIDAPVRAHAPVQRLSREGTLFRIDSGAGRFLARAVIVATGACDVPNRPAWADRLAPRFEQITTRDYVHPGQLAPGGVLVVGASATGVQLAEEIRRAGHEVTIAAGRHVPLPRRYRGRDIADWMQAAGLLSEGRNPAVSAARTLNQPSLQLVGSAEGRDISLATLVAQDVRPVSRVLGAEGGKVLLSGDLGAEMARATDRANAILDRIDAHIAASGTPAAWPDRPAAPRFVASRHETLDLDRAGIRTVLWATGFRRDYSWLDLPVLDAHGELREQGGITECPGLYALGLPFMRRRNSSFLGGVGQDAAEITADIARHLGAANTIAA